MSVQGFTYMVTYLLESIADKVSNSCPVDPGISSQSQDGLARGRGSNSRQQSQRQPLLPPLRVHMKTKPHNCNKCRRPRSLVACSLVGDSVSVSHYVTWLVDSVFSCGVFDLSGSFNPSCHSFTRFLEFFLLFGCESLNLFLSAIE